MERYQVPRRLKPQKGTNIIKTQGSLSITHAGKTVDVSSYLTVGGSEPQYPKKFYSIFYYILLLIVYYIIVYYAIV